MNPVTDRLFVPWVHPTAAYIHIPFCQHHCGYCDFAVTAGQDHTIDLYLEALHIELQTLQQPTPVRTIFVGGGTPTYLNPDQLQRLLTMLCHWLPLQADGEWSMEATPESITPEKVDLLAHYGVNRISLGVQSFQGHLLPVLDRIHRPEHLQPALEWLQPKIPNRSLDLIFGIPGQTRIDWQTDLQTALRFGIRHLSTYGLTYEKGTPLWKQQQRGEVQSLEEEQELAMYEWAMDYLEMAGLRQYEISNFAVPGCECRHNEIYWANHAYYGFGVGAARYVHGWRELNCRNTQDYIRRIFSEQSATFQRECLDPKDRAKETIVIQLRRSQGIQRRPFEEQTGYTLDSFRTSKWDTFLAEKLLEDTGESLFLTRRGKCVADAIMSDIL